MASPSERVHFRGGFTARLDVVQTLLALEGRGARFVPMPDGGFKVCPAGLLTDEDRAVLTTHRAEARALVHYQADDAHLFTDSTQAQGARIPSPRQQRKEA